MLVGVLLARIGPFVSSSAIAIGDAISIRIYSTARQSRVINIVPERYLKITNTVTFGGLGIMADDSFGVPELINI